ncbi:hypothetical protein [Chromohalobacter japonicus]|uniref:hypothetical protein n=1 Tax=Chromohalobacter japonicus TaxID=223900 RepID=UPI00069446A0|nr:hypothetical protein [Chromohalobacter japonicus]
MSLQFDSAYYLAENPDVAEAINEGQVQSAQWHFDNYGAAEGRDPNATFDVSYYLEQNTDVAEAFEAGTISNPFDHFLEYGAGEGRAPSANLEAVAAGFDEEAYLSANTDVATAVENGVFGSGYEHWVVYGRDEEDRPEATYNGGTPVSDAQASDLTEALGDLQTANADVATAAEELNTFLTENEDYTLTEVEASVDGVDAAIEQADAELETATDARDDFVENTADGAESTYTSITDFMGGQQRMNEGNLQAALTAAQDAIDADEAEFTVGGTERADADSSDLVYEITNAEGETQLVTDAFDGDAGVDGYSYSFDGADATVATIGFDSALDADDELSFDLNGTEYTATFADSSFSVDSELPEDFILKWDSDTDAATLEGPDGELFSLSDVALSDDADAALDGDIGVVFAEGPDLAVGTAAVTDGEVEPGNVDSFMTVADLQDAKLAAESDLETARNGNSDEALLTDVRSAINAYLGEEADGTATIDDADANYDSLIETRDLLAGALDDADATDQSIETALSNLADGLTSAELEAALAGTVDADGDATDADAGFGQGEWVFTGDDESDAAPEDWEYQPTAEEQTLLTALENVESRDELLDNVTATTNAFEGTDLGTAYASTETAIADLATFEQNVDDAEQLVADVTEQSSALTEALEQQADAEAWFTDNDYALPTTLDADQSATEDGDIFVFSEDEGNGFSISGFGAEGEDTLYFGEGFTVTALGDDQAITDRVGSVDTLEIFTQQDGADLQLFVEADAAAGFDRGDLATEQMTKVTLENFSTDDITGSNSQSLVAGVAPATEETIA